MNGRTVIGTYNYEAMTTGYVMASESMVGLLLPKVCPTVDDGPK